MGEIYLLMQRQARAWERSWEQVRSTVRGEAYANWDGRKSVVDAIRWDMTLAAPALPALPDLQVSSAFREKYETFLAEAQARMPENEQLILALQSNFAWADRNRYNLEVFLALARFFGHHWRLLAGMAESERLLVAAQAAEARQARQEAVELMVNAHDSVDQLVKERVGLLAYLTAVFEKSRYPRGQAVGGRKFVDINDDTKDYWAQRRPDMTYLTRAEESIGLEKWRDELRQAIEAYSRLHNVPAKGLASSASE